MPLFLEFPDSPTSAVPTPAAIQPLMDYVSHMPTLNRDTFPWQSAQRMTIRFHEKPLELCSFLCMMFISSWCRCPWRYLGKLLKICLVLFANIQFINNLLSPWLSFITILCSLSSMACLMTSSWCMHANPFLYLGWNISDKIGHHHGFRESAS